MPRLLPLVCISIAVLMAALAAACDKSPTAPNRPTGGGSAPVRLEPVHEITSVQCVEHAADRPLTN
jgi:hypothetical protein